MRLMRPAVAIGLTAATALLFAGQSPAGATATAPLAPATHFTMGVHQDGTVDPVTSGAAIPNIDSDKATLRAYYGATKGTDPADPTKTIYLPNLSGSPYAKNTEAVADGILKALPTTAASGAAVVFDVDSTLLSDYANEEEMNFNYNSTLNAAWVNGALFPAVAGMPDLVRTLASEGYKIYGITGRPGAQEPATLTNLANDGYTADGTSGGTPLFTAGTLYTKDLANQPWVDCTLDGSAATACSTVEYKALTRKHIQDTDGVNIVMNVGDQYSDLEGGYAAAYTKMPNPSYFLQSPDIPGAPASDSTMVLPKSYTMAPDGSSGATATNGDNIPNESEVVAEIRNYYNAAGTAPGSTKGIADKNNSPYITEMAGLEKTWTDQITTSCQHAAHAITAAKHRIAMTTRALAKAKSKQARSRLRAKLHRMHVPGRPAVVFDADDTTLWTYDMEDGAMGFNFDPTLQDTWVQDQKFPAVPGMPELEGAVADAGCTVFGLTGRGASQKYATLGNLAKDGYSGFSANRFFTKWSSDATQPSYITGCSLNGNATTPKCSTIQYKSMTRKHIEDLGFNIVANLGDQFSDLIGGYADKTYKLPNPTYYLP